MMKDLVLRCRRVAPLPLLLLQVPRWIFFHQKGVQNHSWPPTLLMWVFNTLHAIPPPVTLPTHTRVPIVMALLLDTKPDWIYLNKESEKKNIYAVCKCDFLFKMNGDIIINKRKNHNGEFTAEV